MRVVATLSSNLVRSVASSLAVLAFVGAIGFGGTARAGTLCTTAGFTGIVNNLDADAPGSPFNSGCEIGSTQNDSPRPGQVNTDAMFGITNWQLFQDATGVNATSGSFDLPDDFFSTYTFAMIVLKDGEGIPGNYVGYLLDLADFTGAGAIALTGAFTSPFTNPTSGNLKDISHYTIYANPVPLPGALPLLLAALGGLLGFFGWRRRRAVA